MKPASEDPTVENDPAPGLEECLRTLAIEGREAGSGPYRAATDRLPGVEQRLIDAGINEKWAGAYTIGIALGIAIARRN